MIHLLCITIHLRDALSDQGARRGVGMVDIHCHICYGSDDGAESLRVAVSMIELAARCGTKGIAVTPHSNVPGSYRNYMSDGIIDKLASLRRSVTERGINVQLFSGMEIYMTDNAVSLLEKGELITLNGTKYPLVEFDFGEREDSAVSKLNRLISAGYVPIVAHPERYGFVIEDEGAPIRLRSMGCLLQVNKGSIEGHFGEMPFVTVHRMLRHQLADIAASDAHSPYMRTPDMSRAHEIVSDSVSFEYAQLIFNDNPIRVLQDKEALRY